MLSFRNNRRNIMCFFVQQRWVTKSTFSHMVTRVAYLRSPRYDRNESESWTLFRSLFRPALHFPLYTVAFTSCMKYNL